MRSGSSSYCPLRTHPHRAFLPTTLSETQRPPPFTHQRQPESVHHKASFLRRRPFPGNLTPHLPRVHVKFMQEVECGSSLQTPASPKFKFSLSPWTPSRQGHRQPVTFSAAAGLHFRCQGFSVQPRDSSCPTAISHCLGRKDSGG